MMRHDRNDEVEQLRRWKSEAADVILGLQDLGKALGLRLGERITGASATEAAKRLSARAEAAEAEVERLTGALADNEQAYTKRVAAWSREKERAEKAEAVVARVESLASRIRTDGITCECGHTLDEHNGLGCYARLSYTPFVTCRCTATDDRTDADLLDPLLRAALKARHE